MSFELEPFGIKTVIIEPGVIDTDFPNALRIANLKIDTQYALLMKAIENKIKKMIGKGFRPEYVAEVLLEFSPVKIQN
jgi:NAD(P)-dependent dehydrogenase (short-subunit alcohol dehydrogenase family)